MILASSRARRPGACRAEAGANGPGVSSQPPRPQRGDPIRYALLVTPPFPWLRPSISRICVGSQGRDTQSVYRRTRAHELAEQRKPAEADGEDNAEEQERSAEAVADRAQEHDAPADAESEAESPQPGMRHV